MKHIAVVFDESGSMDTLKNEVVGAVQKFIDEQKAIPTPAQLTLVLFHQEHHVAYEGDVQTAPALDYNPGGFTALNDAIGWTIEHLDKSVDEAPLVCIVTDGLENASRKYSREKVAELIKDRQDKYSWNFVYLAANQDAAAVGATYNFSATNSEDFAATPKGLFSASASLSARSTSYRT